METELIEAIWAVVETETSEYREDGVSVSRIELYITDYDSIPSDHFISPDSWVSYRTLFSGSFQEARRALLSEIRRRRADPVPLASVEAGDTGIDLFPLPGWMIVRTITEHVRHGRRLDATVMVSVESNIEIGDWTVAIGDEVFVRTTRTPVKAGFATRDEALRELIYEASRDS